MVHANSSLQRLALNVLTLIVSTTENLYLHTQSFVFFCLSLSGLRD